MLKKLRYLFLYIRILNRNRDKLRIEHGISIDWVYRMYKTFNIPQDELDNIRVFGFKYFDDLLKKEITKIDQTFVKLGLSELSGLMEVVELNERQVGMAFRFKYLNTAKIFSRLVWLIMYIIGGLVAFLISQTFLSVAIGLLSIFVIYLITRIIV